MPQMTKHRRFRRATVLIKRTQCLGKYPRNRGCMPSYELLRSNNSCLAKALSKQKQKGQLLFSQNVALLAEVQNLSSACNKRDNIMGKVLQNAKEMLKMLVTMTKFVTSTISSCQEFASSSNANLRMSCNSLSRLDDRRLSARSPTRGIVKPMVSGHTITKPTINLSRVNMRHISNPSNLSTIEEASTPVTPTENSDVNNDRSPATVTLRQARNVTGRRMPERLNITSPRFSEGDERRLSKRNSRHSGKLSETCSKSRSSRFSQPNMERYSIERTELMGSPRVKLNDVSRLLQNCQTINIRRLGSVPDDPINESSEINDSANNTSVEPANDNIISETQESMLLSEENNDLENINDSEISNDESPQNSKKSFISEELGVNIETNSKRSHNNVSSRDDPLEGSSWMFNNCQKQSSLTNVSMRTNSVKASINKSSGIHRSIAKTSASHTIQNNKENVEYVSSSSEDENSIQNEKNIIKSRTSERENILNNCQENYKIEEDYRTNIQRFVTQQRGSSIESIDDDIDDFTLMYRRRSINNIPFDINDLRLPVLEDSVVKSVVTKEPEPEITATLHKITQNCLIPTNSNDIRDTSLFDNSMVKLPLLSNTAIDCTIPVVDISLDTRQLKNLRKSTKTYKADNPSDTTPPEKKNRKQKKKSKNDKDPSAAKVVLQKLNDSHVKPQTPPPVEAFSQRSSSLSKKFFNSSSLENSSDSESSTASTNSYAENCVLKRPRRQKAPTNLKEPSLSKKLRRLQ